MSEAISDAMSEVGPATVAVARPGRESRPQPWWPWRVSLEVRLHRPGWQRFLIVACSIAVGVAISAVILAIAGVPAGDLAGEFVATIVDRQSLQAVLVQTTPLIFVGTAACIAFRARFWNLGLEGQMVMGAVAATAVALQHPGPEWARLPMMAAAATMGGMAWVLVPSILKSRFAVSEIIATLLLNYVATYFLDDLLFGAWKDPVDSFPHSAEYAAAERLPDLAGGINVALPAAIVVVVLVWWLTQFSRAGFYLRFIFANTTMARRVGIPVAAMTLTAVLLSGASAGLAGFVITSGMEGRLTQGFYEGYGFSGVLIAFLSANNPIAAAIVAFLLGMLFVTSQSLQILYQIPFAMVQLIQAVIVMCVAGSSFFVRHRVNIRR